MLVRNRGLELPIHEKGTSVAWTTEEIGLFSDKGHPTFVRRVKLEYRGEGNLRTALKLADIVIANAAEALGVSVVEYQWGLTRTTRAERRRNPNIRFHSHGLVPRGYNLVAEVATVQDAHPLDDSQIKIVAPRINQYYIDAPRQAEVYLGDLGPRQCVSSPQALDRAVPQLTLVDIEPRLHSASWKYT